MDDSRRNVPSSKLAITLGTGEWLLPRIWNDKDSELRAKEERDSRLTGAFMSLKMLETRKEPLTMLALEPLGLLQGRLLALAVELQVEFAVKHGDGALESK